jgi:ComF family protein
MALRLSFQNIFNRFIDIIYPPRCHICQDFFGKHKPGNQLICNTCLAEFAEITSPLCPICSRTFHSLDDEDHWCEECLRKRPRYDAMGAPYKYEGKIMDAIHQLKYGGKTYLVRSLGPLLASFAARWLDGTQDFLMMPVPLHSKKLRERGFNQSLLLAKAIRPLLGLEIDFLSLRRIKYTQPQTGLRKEQRRKNVRRAFGLGSHANLKGRTVLLIDDVATTTSTLNECARVLKKGGCDKVFCLVLARAMRY